MKRIPFRLEDTQEYQDLLRQQEVEQSRTPASAIAQALRAKNVGPVAVDPAAKAQREYDYATQPPEVIQQGIAMLPEAVQPVAELLAPSRADLLTMGATKLGSLAAKATGLAKPAQGMVRELITYHGTPHTFPAVPDNPLGAFDASKIGTGEGAQAFGHGIYLAESPDVASGYKRILGNREFEIAGKKLYASSGLSSRVLDQQSKAETIAADALDDAMNAQSSVPAQFAANRLRQMARQYPEEASSINDALNIIADWEQTGSASKMSGALYTADLPDAMIDRMLNWDKPLSEQPPAVRKALERLNLKPKTVDSMSRQELINTLQYIDPNGVWDDEASMLEFGSIPSLDELKDAAREMDIDEYLATSMAGSATATGQSLYKQLAAKAGGGKSPWSAEGQKAASEALRAAGVRGIKYLDAASRGTGKGTRNFVVFPGEESNVKILKRE